MCQSGQQKLLDDANLIMANLITKIFCVYEVGDKVLLRVAPNQPRLKFGKSRKLSPRFCGPFEIVKRG